LKHNTTKDSELSYLNEIVFMPCGLQLTNLEIETESQDYFAHQFKLNGKPIKFRTAKTTPTKIGQFVTLWKRNEKGITEPYNIFNEFDFYIIATRKDKKLGVFIFPKTVLHSFKILSDTMMDGKRGFRVYPIWDIAANKQAQKTQDWQLKYFINISLNHAIDKDLVEQLFNPNITLERNTRSERKH